MTDKKPGVKPMIDTRFIYQISRKNRKTMRFESSPELNADGHLDFAYQHGNLKDVVTEVVDSHFTEDGDGGHTHWVMVKATIHVGDRIVTGLAGANSRKVSEPGFEIQVAETRALKRAIAVAYNITEKIINPSGTMPTREIVDIHIDERNEDFAEVPQEIRKPMDIIDSDDQFKV